MRLTALDILISSTTANSYYGSSSLERCCKFMIPAVIILPHALEGYKYILTPRWEFLFDLRTWMLAL